VNKTLTGYIIVTSYIVVGLSIEVQQHMSKGWQPIGGVSFDGGQYLQAMVRYEENKE
jgi:hypothetical protein